jgi:hypothetical protein
MTGNRDHDVLFEILLDDDAKGLTVIQGAPIHSCEDLRRARAALARVGRSPLSAPARPPF